MRVLKALSRVSIKTSKIKSFEKYLCCTKAGLQEMLAYRFQYCMGLFLLLIPFAIKNCIWLLAFRNENEIAGYTFETILLYNCLMLIIGSLISTNAHWEIANEIKSGDLSKYLAKPIHHRNYWFSKQTGSKAGQAAYIFLLSGIVYLACPGVFGKIKFIHILAGSVVFALAYIMNFLIYYNFSLLSFRFLEISSFFAALELILGFLNGEYLPIDLMPEIWVRISRFLPVNTGIYFVVQTIMGTYSWREILCKLCIQSSWILLLWFCASRGWKRGIKKYESVGV